MKIINLVSIIGVIALCFYNTPVMGNSSTLEEQLAQAQRAMRAENNSELRAKLKQQVRDLQKLVDQKKMAGAAAQVGGQKAKEALDSLIAQVQAHPSEISTTTAADYQANKISLQYLAPADKAAVQAKQNELEALIAGRIADIDYDILLMLVDPATTDNQIIKQRISDVQAARASGSYSAKVGELGKALKISAEEYGAVQKIVDDLHKMGISSKDKNIVKAAKERLQTQKDQAIQVLNELKAASGSASMETLVKFAEVQALFNNVDASTLDPAVATLLREVKTQYAAYTTGGMVAALGGGGTSSSTSPRGQISKQQPQKMTFAEFVSLCKDLSRQTVTVTKKDERPLLYNDSDRRYVISNWLLRVDASEDEKKYATIFAALSNTLLSIIFGTDLSSKKFPLSTQEFIKLYNEKISKDNFITDLYAEFIKTERAKTDISDSDKFPAVLSSQDAAAMDQFVTLLIFYVRPPVEFKLERAKEAKWNKVVKPLVDVVALADKSIVLRKMYAFILHPDLLNAESFIFSSSLAQSILGSMWTPQLMQEKDMLVFAKLFAKQYNLTDSAKISELSNTLFTIYKNTLKAHDRDYDNETVALAAAKKSKPTVTIKAAISDDISKILVDTSLQSTVDSFVTWLPIFSSWTADKVKTKNLVIKLDAFLRNVKNTDFTTQPIGLRSKITSLISLLDLSKTVQKEAFIRALYSIVPSSFFYTKLYPLVSETKQINAKELLNRVVELMRKIPSFEGIELPIDEGAKVFDATLYQANNAFFSSCVEAINEEDIEKMYLLLACFFMYTDPEVALDYKDIEYLLENVDERRIDELAKDRVEKKSVTSADATASGDGSIPTAPPMDSSIPIAPPMAPPMDPEIPTAPPIAPAFGGASSTSAEPVTPAPWLTDQISAHYKAYVSHPEHKNYLVALNKLYGQKLFAENVKKRFVMMNVLFNNVYNYAIADLFDGYIKDLEDLAKNDGEWTGVLPSHKGQADAAKNLLDRIYDGIADDDASKSLVAPLLVLLGKSFQAQTDYIEEGIKNFFVYNTADITSGDLELAINNVKATIIALIKKQPDSDFAVLKPAQTKADIVTKITTYFDQMCQKLEPYVENAKPFLVKDVMEKHGLSVCKTYDARVKPDKATLTRILSRVKIGK